MRQMSKIFWISILLNGILFAPAFSDGEPRTTVDSLDKEMLNWHNKDKKKDKVPGVSVEKAYADLLQGKTPTRKIIVAVIDGGVDIDHEDLKGKIWINEDEIPDNGIDDDKNGYIDDVHGWNFIGNSDGENINYENLEYTRIYKKYKDTYGGLIEESSLNEKEKEEYDYYLKARKKYFKELTKYQAERPAIEAFEARIEQAEYILKTVSGEIELDLEKIKKIEAIDDNVGASKALLIQLYKNGYTKDALGEYKKQVDKFLDYYLNLDFNPREIIPGSPDVLFDTVHGNSDVAGPSAEHGTFVGGIIAANRNNGIGINGIADNVEIMPIRTIPQGDEYDKDVALAIRYAVDNGAHIINMSFGKLFSPQKLFVDDAIRHAVTNNILMVHGAGNDAKNIDTVIHYPTNFLDDGTISSNWLTIGATSISKKKDFIANFTNYGAISVDLFAPGVDIISLYPGSKYDKGSGTSFSCPVVSGIAALVWSYYPELTAEELKNILIASAIDYSKKTVNKPNKLQEEIKTRFGELSVTGGVVNAVKALEEAEKTYRQKGLAGSE